MIDTARGGNHQARARDPHTWRQGFGGETSNMAIAPARLGARSGCVTHVGNDEFGRHLTELWTHVLHPDR